MTITFYNNSSDPRIVRKNLSTIATYNNVQVTADMGIESPTILINMFSGIQNCNYCYISEFGRYYYLSPNVVNGNQVTFSGEVDVLMSFYNRFSSSDCIAERSSNAANNELEDKMLPFKSRPKYIYRKLSTGFKPSSSGGCYILTLGGK